ncbi:MAG: hypothetical protein PHN48_12415, partial [Parabacteroides sp.]|nr:hypothetical protein [Parabacteroides sp.]
NLGGIAGNVSGSSSLTGNTVSFAETVSSAGATSNLGGIAGNADATGIINSNVTFAKAVSTTGLTSNLGGIAGNVSGTSSLSGNTVSFTETVSALADTSNVGGIAGNVSGTTALTSNKVTAAKLISANTTDSYAGGIVGYALDLNVSVTNNSFNSAVASPDHAVSATSGIAAGCIAGNETEDAGSLYGLINATYTTTIDANATDFVINGNTCSCGQHAHPVNAKSNDFMAGKNHTQPQITLVAPVHDTAIGSADIGDVSIYAPIKLTFDKPMDHSTTEAAFSVFRLSDDGTYGSAGDVIPSAHYTTDYFDYSWTQDSQTMTATLKAQYGSFEYNRAYRVQLVVKGVEPLNSINPAKDIFGNIAFGARVLAHDPDFEINGAGNVVTWTFKTLRGDKPQISTMTFERDRRDVIARFSANVTLNGIDVTASATKYMGVYYSTNVNDTNPTAQATGWSDKLHDPNNLKLTASVGHNHVIASETYKTGLVECLLTNANLTNVDTLYYLVPYVITTDGFIHFGASQTVVVHPWNLRDGNNTASVLDKQTDGLTGNAFIIETADDLTNLNLAANGAAGSEGLKGDGTLFSSLAQLTASYWTQPCHFVQTKDIVPVVYANPIGTDTAAPFTGSYNGVEHSIAGLEVAGNTKVSGMFGAFAGTTVKNLTVSALTLTGATTGSVGLIASISTNATIDNITLNNVNVSGITGAANVAGLIGATNDSTVAVNNVSVTFLTDAAVSGNSAAGLIGTAGSNTFITNANVTTQGTGAITGVTYASGLVGMFNGTGIDNANVSLSAALSTTGANSFVGGIAGNAVTANISNSDVAFAQAVSTAGLTSNLGGIAGKADATDISNSNVTFAQAVSTTGSTSNLGGIAGNVSGSSSLTGNTVSFAETVSSAAATSNLGGIAGNADATAII